MKFKLLLVIALLFMVFFKSNAQDYKLGRVSIAELQEKVHPKDSSAVAAVLFKKGRTYFSYDVKKGFVANHEIQIRIKIYKKEGLDWANFEVPYYVGYEKLSPEAVRFSDGVTYNIENGSIVKTKLNSEGTFKDNVNENWKKATVTMPNVKVGSVIELKYTTKSENLTKFPVFQIQYPVPANHVEYCSEIPEYFIYKQLLTGYVKVKSDSKLEQTSQIYDNEYRQTQSIIYQQIKSTFVVDDVPPLLKENYVDNMNNYKSSLQFELETTRYPNQPVKDYSQTWDGVARVIYDEKSFGQELQERLYLLEDLRAISANQDKSTVSDLDKMNVIFKFIQSKMNWNEEYGYYTDKGVKQAYLDRTGNVAEINFNLINMLNLAGISANPVLVSTREHGIPVFPNRTVFNYVIAAVNINGERILLDAVNKYTTPNILPLNVLNWNGRLIRQDGSSEEINLVPSKPSRQNYNLKVAINGGNISGKYLVQKTDYEALIFREREATMKSENYLEKKENEFNGIEISDYTVENKNTDLSKAVIEKFTFASNNHCEIIGGKTYINPLLFFTMNKNPFFQEKRTMPVYFGYPQQEKYNLNFEIPEGYEIESIPKAIKIATDDKKLVYSVNSLVQGNNIQIVVVKEINVGMVSADFYDGLKGFYQKMIETQHEKIVLKKI